MSAGSRTLPLLLGIIMISWACEPAPPSSDPELREALGIDDGVPIHEILLSGRGDRTRILPAHVEIRAGDVVQFRVVDRRVHRIAFELGDVTPEVRSFLVSSNQVAPAPLVERDARLVLDFTDAPEGRYPYVVEGYGEPVRGSIRVR